MKAILTFGMNRPRYLRILMQSLRAANQPADWGLLVSLDGPEGERGYAPICQGKATLKVWPTHVGNLAHVMRSLEWAVELGADTIFFLDEDMVVRTDIFDHIARHQPDGEAFFCMAKGGKRIESFCPLGNVVKPKMVEAACQYVRSKAWVGKPRPEVPGDVLWDGWPGYDALFNRFVRDTGRWIEMSPISYAGHIGVVGVDAKDTALEPAIFRGPEETWLKNAIEAFKTQASGLFVPHDFEYA